MLALRTHCAGHHQRARAGITESQIVKSQVSHRANASRSLRRHCHRRCPIKQRPMILPRTDTADASDAVVPRANRNVASVREVGLRRSERGCCREGASDASPRLTSFNSSWEPDAPTLPTLVRQIPSLHVLARRHSTRSRIESPTPPHARPRRFKERKTASGVSERPLPREKRRTLLTTTASERASESVRSTWRRATRLPSSTTRPAVRRRGR